MRKVSLDDLVGLSRYASVRGDFRRRIVELKRDRRVAVGDEVTLVFENFDTVLFQIQEMLHVERISDIDKIREECDVYNALLPGDRELSATLFIEITDPAQISDKLNRLVGIDEHVSLVIGDRRIPARFEAGRSREDKISAVQYVRFPLDEAAARLLAAPGTTVRVAIDHPAYRAEATLAESQRASLAVDLAP
ncbi:MAG TPA: DUF3501 family protein [Candidatus Binatia bacterium]|nr:DUF3501 family protein [Candidatus Binatia bacterium]